jgi:acyl-CoA thioester hydrolase
MSDAPTDRGGPPIEEWAHPVRVRYSEVDNQGIVYNTRYLEYVDHAVTMWFRAQGMVYEEMRHRSFDFSLRHAEVEWIAPARADDLLDVTVKMVTVGTTSFTMLSEVRKDDTIFFRMRVVYVSVDPETGQKAPVPPFVRELMGR